MIDIQFLMSKAKKAEANGLWKEAAEIWNTLGRYEDREACLLIVKGIEKGTEYRDRTRELISWVDDSVDRGVLSLEEAVKTISPKLREIYNEIYK